MYMSNMPRQNPLDYQCPLLKNEGQKVKLVFSGERVPLEWENERQE
jgi:hypothetical protein